MTTITMWFWILHDWHSIAFKGIADMTSHGLDRKVKAQICNRSNKAVCKHNYLLTQLQYDKLM